MARRDIVVVSTDIQMPGSLDGLKRARAVSGQQAGLHFVLWLPTGVSEADFCSRAAAVGLTLQPLGKFCDETNLPPAVIIGYTALTLAQIRFHGRVLATLLKAA